MRLAGWPSSRSMKVRLWTRSARGHSGTMVTQALEHLGTTEMLTPIDQPLDKLEDLKPDEMYAPLIPYSIFKN